MAGPGIRRYRTLSTGQQAIVVALICGLVLGLLIAPFAWQATAVERPDRVAVVPIVGVLEGENTHDVVQRLTAVRQDRSIDAVVLLIDSPGGLAVDGEEIFLQVERTAQKKPVVAVINLQGASAGYKVALPAEKIFVKPASSVGSVGTILIHPQPLPPIDGVLESGPQKVDGDTTRGWEYRSQMVAESFVQTVVEYRGDRLELTPEEIAHARIYGGIEAVHLGVADDIGDLQGGIQEAAALAELEAYDVVIKDYQADVRFLDRAAYTASTQENKRMVTMNELADLDGDEVVPTVWMLPAAALSDLDRAEETNATATNASVEGGVDES